MYDCSTGPNDPPRRCHNTHRCTRCTSPNAKQKLARNSIRSMQLVLCPLICCLCLVCKFAILQACAGAASVGPLVHTIDAFISICRFSSCRLNGRASQLAEYVLRHLLGPSFIEVPSSRQAVPDPSYSSLMGVHRLHFVFQPVLGMRRAGVAQRISWV